MPRWIQVGEISFGSRGPDGKSQRVTVTLPAALAGELVRDSVDRNTTVSAVVREAVTEYFARREPEDAPEFVGMATHSDARLSERVEELIAEDVADGDR